MKFPVVLSLFASVIPHTNSSWLGNTVVDIATENEKFSTLVTFLDLAGLVPILDSWGSYTVFAPSNEAFDKLPDEVVSKYKGEIWKSHLQSLLLYHVLGTRILSTDLSVGLEAITLEGNTIEVTSLEPVTINDSEVISPDIMASNGVLHVMDSVLLPPSATDTIVDIAVKNPDFSTLVDLLGKADLVETLQGDGPFTVFAPTNAAFKQLPPETVDFLVDPDNISVLNNILLYHVVQGIATSGSLSEGQKVQTVEGSTVSISLYPVTINNAVVVVKDILASNGVIHVVDSVLLPSTVGTVADIIKSDDTFSTLESLLENADLMSVLDGDGPFTLFAPTDSSFEALPANFVASVTGDAIKLANVLTYHVISGKVLSADLEVGLEAETVFPENFIEVTSVHPPIINSNTHIAAYDILATNGVIHIVTSVLIPEGLKLEGNEQCESSALCKSKCCAWSLFFGSQCRHPAWYTICV